MDNPFDIRRQENPQGVIVDLLKQSKRQAKTIYEKSLEIKELGKVIIKLTKELDNQKKKNEKDLDLFLGGR